MYKYEVLRKQDKCEHVRKRVPLGNGEQGIVCPKCAKLLDVEKDVMEAG